MEQQGWQWVEGDPAEIWYDTVDWTRECSPPLRAWKADVAEGQRMVIFLRKEQPDYEFWAQVRMPSGSWMATQGQTRRLPPTTTLEETQQRAWEVHQIQVRGYKEAFGDVPAKTLRPRSE